MFGSQYIVSICVYGIVLDGLRNERPLNFWMTILILGVRMKVNGTVNELTNTLKQNYLSEYSDLRKQKLEIEERMNILDGEISKIILLENGK